MKQAPLKEREVMSTVRLTWYAWALLAILIVLGGSVAGYLHPLFGLLAVFALVFWLFSLLFVLYGKFKYRKRPNPR